MSELKLFELEDELSLSTYARFLKKYGMLTGAIYYKDLNETVDIKSARVVRFMLENGALPQYKSGQRLYAAIPFTISQGVEQDDVNNYGFTVDFEGNCRIDHIRFSRLYNVAENNLENKIIDMILANARGMASLPSNMRYIHGGVHNIVDFEFILEYGLDGYEKLARKKLEELNTQNAGKEETSHDYIEKKMFYEGMIEVAVAYINFNNRYIEMLCSLENTFEGDKESLLKLCNALKTVPFNPPTSFYEAFVSYQSMMVFSDCYEPGRIDSLLCPYFEADLAKGVTSIEEATLLFRELFSDINDRYGHPGAVHATIGGTKLDGSADYNILTKVCIDAIGGLRMPNVTLRVRDDMPKYIWDAYLENMSKGYGQPALVNEKLFIDGLISQYNVPFEDAINYVFGGCSEVLIQGKTMCDSTWVAYNMLDVFENTMYNKLLSCDTYEEFYSYVKKDICISLKDMADQINIWQHAHGLHVPASSRSLFTGCLDSGVRFSNGGTKYNFDSTNVYGTTNTINSLYTIKKLFSGELGDISKEEFLQSFISNYKGYQHLHAKYKNVMKFGNYNEELNEIAHDITGTAFSKIKEFKCYRGDGDYMPAIILWVTWVGAGYKVGATPDGRFSSEALADSAGPMQGTDLEGPTSTMGATLAIPQYDCVGTCVLNIRLDPQNFVTSDGRDKVRMLLETYLEQGGCQLQVNVVDPEVLLDAMVHPEKHRDIIVRVGGFSDNFVMLSDDIKKQVLKRVQHSI